MNENVIIPFESRNDTFFFWNMDDYPVPVDKDLTLVSCEIETALGIMGFRWPVDICVNCQQLEYDEEELYEAGRILYLPKCAEAYRKLAAVPTLDMTFYMLTLAEDTAPEHANVAVISRPYPELHRVLHCLKSRGHHVLLIEPPPDGEFPLCVGHLVRYAQLLGRGKPRFKRGYDLPLVNAEDDGDDHLSNMKMLDFSEPIRHVNGTRTVIFWDAMDCPFPLSLSPDQIFEKIRSTLLQRGFSDNLTIWAYVDEYKEGSPDTYLGDKTWDSRIYFLPGGDEDSRRIRMLNDMYLLSSDAPLSDDEVGWLFLVSDHFLGDHYYMEMFENMSYRGYHPILVPSDNNISESKWPESLLRYHAPPPP